MVSNALLYVLLRLCALILPWIPLKLAYRLATMIGSLAYYLVWPARAGLTANLSVVLARPRQDPIVRRTARAVFQHDAKNWVDTLRIDRFSNEELARIVPLEGWDNLDAALAAGRGAILLGMHLGNFDLVGQLFAVRSYHVTVPVERMRPKALFNLLTRGRQSLGIRIIPVDRASRDLPRQLRAGRIVAVMGDRLVGGKGAIVDFFGRPAVLPRGAVALSRLTGAPIVPAYGIRLPDDTFRGFILPPVRMDRQLDDRQALRLIVPVMEAAIREHSEQWLAFRPLWKDVQAREDVDTTIELPAETRA